MSESTEMPRSPELMSRRDTALLVIDVQTKLLQVMDPPGTLLWNIGRLIDAAAALEIPVDVTEQYPNGLGPTAACLTERLDRIRAESKASESTIPHATEIPAKTMFSCRECASIFLRLRDQGVFKILVAGIEAHVCVQQTVLDLLASGFRVFVAVDAVASRFEEDCRISLRRMESSGATLTTTEAALFEWCETASAAEFKTISRLVRDPKPE